MTIRELKRIAKEVQSFHIWEGFLTKFLGFINSKDLEKACQTIVGNLEWFKRQGILFDVEDVIKTADNIGLTWYDNGKLKEEFYIQDGKRNGQYRYWNENGHLYNVSNYKNGNLDGVYKRFDESGDLVYEAFYKDGNLHGEQKEFLNRKLVRLRNYVNGKLNGKDKCWYESGQLCLEQTWKDDELFGECKEWWSNGNLRKHCFFNGYRQRNFYRYDGTGGENIKIGKYQTWHENGIPNIEANYIDGRLEGERKIWNSDFVLIEYTIFKGDYKHGESLIFDFEGKLLSREYFENGILLPWYKTIFKRLFR